MFSVTIDSEEYRVKFAHFPKDPEEPSLCGIFRDGSLVMDGVSDLLPNNKFSRNARRKTAMADALMAMGMSKEERTQFWQAYHDKRGRW